MQHNKWTQNIMTTQPWAVQVQWRAAFRPVHTPPSAQNKRRVFEPLTTCVVQCSDLHIRSLSMDYPPTEGSQWTVLWGGQNAGRSRVWIAGLRV